MKNTEIYVVSGDISRVKADALITAINSGGAWFGGIDGVIKRSAGNFFHGQAAKQMPLRNEQTVVALSHSTKPEMTFDNVVFVVDDLQSPLRNIVYNGLRAAAEAGFKTVSLPTIRMGVMLGMVEKTAAEAMQETSEGVHKFLKEFPDALDRISFVVYNDPDLQHELENALTIV